MVSDTTTEVIAAREHALAELRTARRAVETWVDLIRRDAEHRTGSAESDAVVCDAAYAEALSRWASIAAAHCGFEVWAAAIEAGEVA